MNTLNLYTAVILFLLTSCTNPTNQILKTENDTTKVLRVAIRTAFYQDNLPGILSINQETTLDDTVLFRMDKLVKTYMPNKIDSIYFKFLDKDSICQMVKTWDFQNQEPLGYLEISKFERSDSVYDIFLNSIFLTPDYRRYEDHTQKGVVRIVDSFSCISWGGGGGIYLQVSKQGDGFKAKVMSSSSH